MVLALATGLFYFTLVVTGVSMSAGLGVLIIGVPFVILYFGSVRLLSLVEGRIVEVMLGERMPRRPLYSGRGKPLLQRIKDMFIDPRTWSTQLYFLLMLPLGIAYFTFVVTSMSVAAALIAQPFLSLFGFPDAVALERAGLALQDAPWSWPIMALVGVIVLFASLHVVRFVGKWHGQLAKHLLVKSAQYS
jgi:hypothetical protein